MGVGGVGDVSDIEIGRIGDRRGEDWTNDVTFLTAAVAGFCFGLTRTVTRDVPFLAAYTCKIPRLAFEIREYKKGVHRSRLTVVTILFPPGSFKKKIIVRFH